MPRIYAFSLQTSLYILLMYSPLCSAANDKPVLYIPVDCIPGMTCFIQNYVDTDPSPDYHDYTCGYLSYNGHKGTDFRLPNLAKMQEGVRVLASAPGTVRAVRDGMPDINIKKIDASLIGERLAGNSVAIKHGNGWETQYSHLRKGSVMVKAGDHVKAGQVLGLIGLSGNTEFPHLHFSVRHNGKVIDPFTHKKIDAGCGHSTENSLWDKSALKQLAYQPSGILEGGFTDRAPMIKPLHEYLKIKKTLPDNSRQIYFWIHVFGVQQGDIQRLAIIDPNGNTLVEKKLVIEENQARRLSIIRKLLTSNTWLPGKYTGIYKLIRSNNEDNKTIIYKKYNLDVIQYQQ